jgi:hypothetical protein
VAAEGRREAVAAAKEIDGAGLTTTTIFSHGVPLPLPLKQQEAAIIKRLSGREAAQEAMSDTAYRLSVTKSANHPGPAELTTTIFSHTGTAAS